MVVSFKVFKKSSPNGKLVIYLAKRDFVDNLNSVEPVDGVIIIDKDYLNDRKIFGQLVCSFRYGREEDEVMGLKFQKDLHLASELIHPTRGKSSQNPVTKVQERLLKKLGPNAFPFTFKFPPNSSASVTLQPGPDDEGRPCGVDYFLKFFSGENESDRSHKRSTVTLGIRKVQYAPSKPGRQPCTVVRKDFMLSPGELELETTLDKQLYRHGEKIAVNFTIRNNSNKMVKKIRVMVQQCIDVCIFNNGQYKATVASIETQEGCPLNPGSSLQKTIHLIPSIKGNTGRRGVALDGQLKREDTNLASTTLMSNPEERETFGIIVSYSVKVKLFLGGLGGELAAELPIILMHPKPEKNKLIRGDSQAVVETFRQDTVDYGGGIGPLLEGQGSEEDPDLGDDMAGLRVQ